MENRPHFDAIEMKGGGDAVSAARAVLQTGEFDFAWNMQVEDEILVRLEKGGKGRVIFSKGGGIEHIQLNTTDPWTEVDGERSSLKTKHPTLSDPAVRQALALLVDKDSVEKHIYGRTGTATANFINNPERFRSKTTKYEFNVDKANALLDKAGWVKGADGIRAKDGKKLKFVYQTSINQPRQKTQAIVKQACQKAGIDIEVKAVTASVFFSSDVANPDTYTKFYADLQMYNNGSSARPGSVPAPVLFVGSGDQGEQVAGPQHHALAEQGIRRHPQGSPGRTRSGQARRHAHQAERAGGEQPGRDPDRGPAGRRRGKKQPRRRAERLGQQHLGSAELVPGGLRRQRAPSTASPRSRPESGQAISAVPEVECPCPRIRRSNSPFPNCAAGRRAPRPTSMCWKAASRDRR